MKQATVHPAVQQPWLNSRWVDGIFILSPPFVALLVVALFPAAFRNSEVMPVMYWVILIVMIDVAHVYSTLYRTYFRPQAIKQSPMLVIIPIACYLAGVVFYAVDGMLFWRALAYLAIFHFVRQQYGFMRLYSRQEPQSAAFRLIDTIAIYTATIYPLVYWHLQGGRRFNWFIDGDVMSFHLPFAITILSVLYIVIIIVYIVKEIVFIARGGNVNIPRNLIVAGTFLSWFFGIVYFNGDMAFTTLNVVAHGIPYMALIWVMERKRFENSPTKRNGILTATFKTYFGVLIFVGLFIAFAYLEEGLWDGFVWREHLNFFSLFNRLPVIHDSRALMLLVPLLALPQSTHYVLDGFIWKMKKKGTTSQNDVAGPVLL